MKKINTILLMLTSILLIGQTIKPIGYGFQEKEPDNRFPGIAIEKFESSYFVVGQFDLADSISCSNAAIIDRNGDKFSIRPAGEGTGIPMNKLFVFNNQLFGIQAKYSGGLVRMWNGQNWDKEFYSTYGNINGYLKHNNKLYIYGNDLEGTLDTQKEIMYMENDGIWKYIDVKWENKYINEEIFGFINYNSNFLISTTRGIWEIDSLGNRIIEYFTGTSISLYNSRFEGIDSMVFLKTNSAGIFFLNNGKFDLALKIRYDAGGLFKMNNKIYLGALNEGTFEFKDNKFEYYSFLQFYDIEKIGEKDYLGVGNLFTTPDYKTKLNYLATIKYENPKIDFDTTSIELCENEYHSFYSNSSDMTIKFDWKFPGCIPSYSNSIVPNIKFPNPGKYILSLSATNDIGESGVQTKNVLVKPNCKVERENRYDNTWFLGYSYDNTFQIAGLDFSNGNPMSVGFNARFSINGLSHSMSNKDGRLLYYSNGSLIFNSNHEEVKNSRDFNTDKYINKFGYYYAAGHQNILSLPSSINDSLFYMFHLPIDYLDIPGKTFPTKLFLSEIKVTSDSNIVEMQAKRIPVISDTLANFCMQAHRHCNGEDWWVIVPKLNSPIYYKVLLKRDGSFIVDKSQFGVKTFSPSQSVFSPNGKQFAMVNDKNNETYLWDFNTCDGSLSNLKIIKQDTISSRDRARGCAFSSNSRYLYVSSYHYLRKYDLCSNNFLKKPLLIDEWDGTYEFIYPFSFAKMMLAPNEKIYIASYGTSTMSLSTIHEPNLPGKQCNFKQHDHKMLENTRLDLNVMPSQPNFRPNTNDINCTSYLPTLVEGDLDIKLYPNPATEILLIEHDFEKDIEIEIYNNQGQIIKKTNLPSYKNTLEISDLPNGLLFFSFKIMDKFITKKILKVK